MLTLATVSHHLPNDNKSIFTKKYQLIKYLTDVRIYINNQLYHHNPFSLCPLGAVIEGYGFSLSNLNVICISL